MKISSTLAKEEDGTIQITFTIPKEAIVKAKAEVAAELGKDIEVEGFRKGKAPIEKIVAKIPQTTLIEKALGKILPKAFAGAIEEYKLRPAIHPKFELISAKENENWQVRGISCELPEIVLGDYKAAIRSALCAKSIYVPGKEPARNASQPASQAGHGGRGASVAGGEKEQLVINTLLTTINLTIPRVIVEEEVNARLSNLLSRIEKLGLSLESYLSSIGKNPETLRTDYEENAKKTLVLELILNKVAEEEKIRVDDKEVDKAIEASSADPKLAKKLNTPEQRRIVLSILNRRAALDSLTSLV